MTSAPSVCVVIAAGSIVDETPPLNVVGVWSCGLFVSTPRQTCETKAIFLVLILLMSTVVSLLPKTFHKNARPG